MNSKKMVSSSQQDRLSSLPNELLIMIISLLSFKESLKTSVLSKRWKNLCYGIKNIAFKESEYVYKVDSDSVPMILFVPYMRQWASRFQSQVIESFEIHLCNPMGYVADLEYLIEFAVSRKVKNLVLNFSNSSWRTTNEASCLDAVMELPACVYGLKTLESLYIYACGFDPSRFTNPELLRSLCIGWISLQNVESLLRKCPLLERLSIRYCWELDMMEITGQIKELIIENCNFPVMACFFNLPNIDIFKYSGHVPCFHFEKVNTMIKEVCLDFGVAREYDEPDASNIIEGEVVCHLLNDLRSAKTLTVCPYLLQVIKECADLTFMHRDVKTQHLVLRTKLHPKEFKGIRILLDRCPDLKTLTFDYVPPEPSFPQMDLSYRGIDPRTHWFQNISYRCLTGTLKVVVFRNYIGGSNQLDALNYLVQTGLGLELIFTCEMGWRKSKRGVARAGAAMLQRRRNLARVINVHNA